MVKKKKVVCTIGGIATMIALGFGIRELTDNVPIDQAHFPDQIFRTYIAQNFDKNEDGKLSRKERRKIKEINVNVAERENGTELIQSMSGIEYLQWLEKLDCSHNAIRNLDVSKNQKLEELVCSNNGLRRIDVSKNKNLQLLCVDENQIEELDVGKNTNLTYLSSFGNRLCCLDLSKNKNISKDSNLGEDIVGENVSVVIKGDHNVLSSEWLQEKKIDVSKISSLTGGSLQKTGSGTKIILDKDSKELSYKYDTGLKKAAFRVILVAKKEAASPKIRINESTFPNQKFRDYIENHADIDQDGFLDFCERMETESIGIHGDSVTSIKGIEYFPNLKRLYCGSCKLKKIDVSKNAELKNLLCGENQLEQLDVSNNLQLELLVCSDNQIRRLNLHKNVRLSQLDCSANQLKELDVSRNQMLDALHCQHNQLTQLDVRQNKKLGTLECFGNKLKNGLNLNENTKLVFLNCSGNEMKELDVSKNTELCSLDFSKNKINKISSLGKNKRLGYLNCADNDLTELNISENKELKELYCPDNQLTELNVSRNTKLTTLDCSKNKMKGILDVRKNVMLSELNCTDNEIKIVKMAENQDLVKMKSDSRTKVTGK